MDYRIQNMGVDELKIAAQWAAKEGWNPGVGDENCYLLADPNGFFVGRLGDEIVSFGSAVCFDDDFAFCGFYMVKPGLRGHGYGLRMTQHRLDYVGARCTGIDGVLENVEMYQQVGYVYAHKNFRFQVSSLPQPQANDAIVAIGDIPKDKLHTFDRQCFPAKREALLNCWVASPQRLALGYYQNDTLMAYGVIRPAHEGFRIGPLFAHTAAQAEQLLLHLATAAGSSPIYIDMPDNNPAAMALAQKYRFKAVFATARMYRHGMPELDARKVFAITNYELG